MKKIFMLALLLAGFGFSNLYAQGGDPAAAIARMKERMKPALVEKAKLSDAEADKVVEINFESQRGRRTLRDLPAEERDKKLAEMNADRDKKFAAIPLTPEQVKAVNDVFEEMRRNAPPRGGRQRP